MFELKRAKRHSKCKNCGDLIQPGEMCLEWRTFSYYGGRLCNACLNHAAIACSAAKGRSNLAIKLYHVRREEDRERVD